MNDIVKRLRSASKHPLNQHGPNKWLAEAADLITALTARAKGDSITDITIPREALEAGKDTAFAWLRSHMEDDVRVQQMTDEELTELVSAACLAMLKHWPGVHEVDHLVTAQDEVVLFSVVLPIILPLTESGNAKG